MRIGVNAISRRMGGGTRTYLANLLPALAQQQSGWDFLVWHNERDDFLASMSQERYRCIPIPAGICENYLRRLAFEQWDLVRQCRSHGVDVLFSAVSGTSVLARSLGLPTVAIIHQSLPELLRVGYYRGMARVVRLGYMRWFTRFASRTIVPSVECAKGVRLMCNISPEKLTIIYHGGAGAQFRPMPMTEALQRTRGLLRTDQYVLAVSDIYPYKNFINLIRAFAHLVRERKVEHDLVIVGKAHKASHIDPLLAEVTRQGLENRVRLTGSLKYEDLPAVYSAAALFVNPCTVESFGLPQIEAMACGTPVVVSRASAMPEVCGDAALYFNPADPIDIAEVMHRVLCNKTIRAELKQKGVERAKLFSWERTVREMIALFAELANWGSDGPRHTT